MNKFLKYALEKHEGQFRRNRESYIDHCIRVHSGCVRNFPNLDRDKLQVALIHDVVEDCDVTLDQVKSDLNLTICQYEILKLLTRQVNQSKEDYLSSIINSCNKYVLAIKSQDAYDNSIFLPEDYAFTLRVVKRNPNAEIDRYKLITEKCLEELEKLN